MNHALLFATLVLRSSVVVYLWTLLVDLPTGELPDGAPRFVAAVSLGAGLAAFNAASAEVRTGAGWRRALGSHHEVVVPLEMDRADAIAHCRRVLAVTGKLRLDVDDPENGVFSALQPVPLVRPMTTDYRIRLTDGPGGAWARLSRRRRFPLAAVFDFGQSQLLFEEVLDRLLGILPTRAGPLEP